VVSAQWLENPDPTQFQVLVLDEVSPDTFRGTVTLSSSYAVPGSLFIAASGATNPTLRVLYRDNDDGTGNPCQNNVSTDNWGRVQQDVAVFLDQANIYVTRVFLDDTPNPDCPACDGDGWADNSERVLLAVELNNKSDANFTGLSVRMSTNDPDVECILRPFIDFGDLGPRDTRRSTDAFELLISENARRADVNDDLSATLVFSMESNEFDVTFVPQSVTIDLDLDATGGAGPTEFFEGFEGAGYGQFTTMNLNEFLKPPEADPTNNPLGVIAADGYRCQYSDPDWEIGAPFNSAQGAVCFPSPTNLTGPNLFNFRIDNLKAFAGEQCLHWGRLLDPILGWTSPNSELEAIRTTDPINLGWDRVCSVTRTTFCRGDGDCPGGVSCDVSAPVLRFKHQVSLLDHRGVNAQLNRGPERAMVSGQLADAAGDPLGQWIRLEPFVNLYDTQANSNYFNCTFDPIDDGNTEEDFFDESDPFRSLGPSSTCSPQLSFADQGASRLVGTLGGASDGPPEAGAKGLGTWVEPQFDLSRFRGRRMRYRFLATGLKFAASTQWHPGFINNTAANPDVRDDGWFIDNVRVTDALTDPATLSAEASLNADQVCTQCASATAELVADPPTSAAPGQVVDLDAEGSVLDACLNGVPEFQFWQDVNGDSAVDPNVDTLIRDWTQNGELSVTPFDTTRYIAGVRCATERSCADFATALVLVDCPSTGTVYRPLIRAATTDDFSWDGGLDRTDVVRGDLSTLRTGGSFAGATCLADDVVGGNVVDVDVPAAGAGFYYLARTEPKCNAVETYSSGGAGEVGDRDGSVGGTCPD
jgi:hypothetical protein